MRYNYSKLTSVDETVAQILEQFNFEKAELRYRQDLLANPGRVMLVGRLCLPLSKHRKRS